MRFLILGPLEVYDGERRLSLGGARQRSLLAMLLLNVGEVVSRDRLIDSLWDEARHEEGTRRCRSRYRASARSSSRSGRAGRTQRCSSRARPATRSTSIRSRST